MTWYESEVRALERGRLECVGGIHPPVFYGSSSFTLWTTLAEDVDPGVLNLGFGGSTLEACDYFFERLVGRADPRSLLIYAGDNDLGDGRSAEDVFRFFLSIADQVSALPRRIPFGFISIKPSPARRAIREKIRHLNDLVRADLERRPAGYFVDVYSAMLDAAGKPRTELYQEDGLHLNREGYRLWGRLLQPFRDRILTESSSVGNKSSLI